MENLKWLLEGTSNDSPQVQQLLQCLQHESFNLDVYICSYGGVGSTELSNFLSRHGVRCNLATDLDGLRHIPRPPQLQLGASTAVIYLYGDPLAAVASHYRRGHAYHQALKTSSILRLREADFPPTFDDYVSRGEDLFGLEAHFSNWLETPTTYDILLVRYEHMFASLSLAQPRSASLSLAQPRCRRYEHMFDPPVAHQLMAHSCRRLGDTAVAELAASFSALRKLRRSQVSSEQRQAHGKYAALLARMDALPHVFVRSTEGGVRRVGSPGGAGNAEAAADAKGTGSCHHPAAGGA